jgi:hypothetical protein
VFHSLNTGTGGGTLPRYPGAMSLRHLKIIRHDFAKIYVKMGEILGNFNIFEGNFSSIWEKIRIFPILKVEALL